MREVKVTIKNVYKPISEAERQKSLTIIIVNIMRSFHEKGSLAQVDRATCNHSFRGV